MSRPSSQPPSENPSPSSPSADRSRARDSVVIVDDDPALVETLEDLLATEGYRVEGFTDPTEALARLRRQPLPDLVILDCIMPRLTGTELREALREAGVEVPVLLMTALADPSFCVHPGDAEVLNKPFHLEDLIVEMESRLRPRSGARSVRPSRAARV